MKLKVERRKKISAEKKEKARIPYRPNRFNFIFVFSVFFFPWVILHLTDFKANLIGTYKFNQWRENSIWFGWHWFFYLLLLGVYIQAGSLYRLHIFRFCMKRVIRNWFVFIVIRMGNDIITWNCEFYPFTDDNLQFHHTNM